MKKNIDWDKVDWNKQDIELSKLFGVSREAVRQARLRHGKRSLTPWKRTVPIAETILMNIDSSDMTLSELAKAAGCQERRVKHLLSKIGKTYQQEDKIRGIYDWSKFPAEQWRDKTDKQLAVIIGIDNPVIVTQWRKRHGYVRFNKSRVTKQRQNSRIKVPT
jgi:hypothetical protein